MKENGRQIKKQVKVLHENLNLEGYFLTISNLKQ